MLKDLGSRLTYANVVATGALFIALGGGAYALSGIPDRGGVFHGCVSNATGVLRVVKSASSCQKPKTVRRNGRRVRLPGEFAVAWNQKGQPGANGTNGTNGINGTNGTNGVNGANGATNVVVRTATQDVATKSVGFFGAQCHSGERATGGGAVNLIGPNSFQYVGEDHIVFSLPLGGSSGVPGAGETPTGWEVGFWNDAGSTRTVTFYAICASP